MDVLSDALDAMRVGKPHSALVRRAGAWRVKADRFGGAGFHVVLQGSCWFGTGDGPPVPLGAGDLVFLPHGAAHGLADRPTRSWRRATPVPLDELGATAGDGPGPATVLLCGAYHMDRMRVHPLVAELPEVLHLPARVGERSELRPVVDLLGAELREPRPGAGAAVPALLDTLLLYVLRAWYEAHGHAGGWAAALADPPVAGALQRIHEDPAHHWTVAELARQGALSRAAFARRFTALVGRPPLGYLTWWRMTTAAARLRDGDDTVLAVAAASGYASEFAFAKAFKREYGVAPGRYRRRSREPAPS